MRHQGENAAGRVCDTCDIVCRSVRVEGEFAFGGGAIGLYEAKGDLLHILQGF